MTTLKLHIKKAKKLKPADSNGLSDPYIVIHIYEEDKIVEKFKTKVINKELNPKWNETSTTTKLKNLNVKTNFFLTPIV